MNTNSCPGEPGDLLAFRRFGYYHYAVNVGNGYIVHVTSLDNVARVNVVGRASTSLCCSSNVDLAVIKKERYIDFKDPNDKVSVEDSLTWRGRTAFQRFEIVQRALSKIGQRGYSWLFKNCEHFARWCRYGEEKSDQVDNLAMGLGIATAGVCLGLLVAGAFALSRDSDTEEKEKYRRL